MLYDASVETSPYSPRQSKSLQFTAAMVLCRTINDAVHRVIDYPQNWDDLPDKLATRIALKLKEAGRDNFFEKATPSYRKMSEGVQGHYDVIKKTRILQQKAMKQKHYHCAVALSVTEHGVGNCGEYVSLVVHYLVTKGYRGSRITQISGKLGERNNHTCVALNASKDAVPGNPETYGADCVICDPWIDLVASATQYFKIIDSLDMKFRPKTMTPMSAAF